ncbi:MAG: pilus assembly protein PilM, partial [Candidatus Omnitrophota bacterium]
MKTKRVMLPSFLLRRKTGQGTLLVELSERSIKLVQASEEAGQRQLVHLEAIELESQGEEEIAQKLLTALKRLPLKARRVFASMPRSQITTRMLVLPSTQSAELAKMVEYQIEKEIPFPKEKIIFDDYLIEVTPEGYSRLLLVIAGEEVVRRYLNILKRSGLFPAALFFSSQGLLSWFRRIQAEKDMDFFTALVDIDRFLTHVEIIHRGELYFTRSISIGLSDM